MRYVDLSLPLEDDRRFSPWWARTKVVNQSHAFGAWAIRLVLGLPKRLLKSRLGWANDVLTLSTHGTTHVDAPWHYAPTSGGKPARTIDEMPLDWFHGPAVVLDFSAAPRDHAITVAELQAALARLDHTLRPGDVVLIRTDNDRRWGERAYFSLGPGVSADGTRWLLKQGVRLTGIDAWGWDAPLAKQAAEAQRTGRDDVFWQAHFVGLEREYCHIERLANLAELPPLGATICAFPLKVKRGSAGPSRVVGMIAD
ncbi:MAG TPA: cyclase family protein [Pirellulales bacterium]